MYNLYVVEHSIGCTKVSLKNGCASVATGTSYDKDTVGISVRPKSAADDRHRVLSEGLCGVMVE